MTDEVPDLPDDYTRTTASGVSRVLASLYGRRSAWWVATGAPLKDDEWDPNAVRVWVKEWTLMEKRDTRAEIVEVLRDAGYVVVSDVGRLSLAVLGRVRS